MKIKVDGMASESVDEVTVELDNGTVFTLVEANEQLRLINESFGFLRVTVQSKDVITIKSEW